VMGVPGSDDIMLNYQSTSFHDALNARSIFGLRPAPEFEEWLMRIGVVDEDMAPIRITSANRLLAGTFPT